MSHTATLPNPAITERAQQAIGQIAVELPGATAIFRRLKLDFCCGGQIPLSQACEQKQLDTAAVLAELARLDRPATQEAPQSPSAMIDHILERFHAVHREQLPELIRMARRVEAVHRDNPNVPHGLAAHLEAMEAELLDHMDKEESVLFPALREGVRSGVGVPIQVMRDEHTGHGEQLDRLMALTNDANPPPGACNTWRALYAGIAQLSDDLIQHIHTENNLLFPQFEVQKGCGSGCGCA
ncbi:iron-sulfur cluster repair di-iron protein [Hydrogenophaga crassostreae]|uniref:Iron-sulfur cluster repair di-iron protein n=1 Tax=Hydrogenophaga crassostreae TaxID=1763535 RepID=A0A162YQY0_9BURK|nr:iron-sulfur cluster repair protein YtfE [Hydrogenophaga crassostreae]AOW15087.1 iron-sulfur cluster repair di-iron protein [Hydrogenophaga crassostreae]OAD39540.1 iron-sulfur cluster repair di-iron protein [Hydrogenophaga crassostreae]